MTCCSDLLKVTQIVLQYNPDTAKRHLSKIDPIMAALIKRVGAFRIETEFDLSPFEALTRAIVYQQLSGNSAAAIHGRLTALFDGQICAESLLKKRKATLRKVGLSDAKTLAVRDLAQKHIEGVVPDLKVLEQLENEDIIERLTRVRGVGRWTVEMMLIFRLGRADVLPLNDLGIRRGYHYAYDTEDLPALKELAEVGVRWAPYRSVASWYLWRASDQPGWFDR